MISYKQLFKQMVTYVTLPNYNEYNEDKRS